MVNSSNLKAPPPLNYRQLSHSLSNIQTKHSRTQIAIMKQLTLDPKKKQAPTRDHAHFPSHLPDAKEVKVSPASTGGENASLFFIGTATTIMYVPPARFHSIIY
jgi:hypothetical protein